MTNVICPGCFDLFHDGHRAFLKEAHRLGGVDRHTLVVCVNTDDSAIALKRDKWGHKYPIDPLHMRVARLRYWGAAEGIEMMVVPFDSEDTLRVIIGNWMPCVIAKGPDYVGTKITGEEIAPVILINTPEPEHVKLVKHKTYKCQSPLQGKRD